MRWWDNTIIPLEDAFADEIETQMFPAFGLDAATYRLAWDRSKIPALQEDESAKHAMWREDYRAGGIDRYTYLTKIGEQADEKLKGVLHPSATPKDEGDDNAVKNWDEGKHPRDEYGRWTTGAHHAFPSRDDLPRFFYKGAFDSMCHWMGDPLPEIESKEFQDGKAVAVKKLEPHARPGEVEASVTVLQSNGVEYGSRIGEPTRIFIPIPPVDEDSPVAIFHTHSKNTLFSPVDWGAFLAYKSKNAKQSHILCPDMIYSVYKPSDWKSIKDLTAEMVEQECIEIIMERWMKNIHPLEDDPLAIEEEYEGEKADRIYLAKIMCDRYNILLRKGKRLKRGGE